MLMRNSFLCSSLGSSQEIRLAFMSVGAATSMSLWKEDFFSAGCLAYLLFFLFFQERKRQEIGFLPLKEDVLLVLFLSPGLARLGVD